MSEVENQQETNGTANGDVPEIELIIKEEYICPNEEDRRRAQVQMKKKKKDPQKIRIRKQIEIQQQQQQQQQKDAVKLKNQKNIKTTTTTTTTTTPARKIKRNIQVIVAEKDIDQLKSLIKCEATTTASRCTTTATTATTTTPTTPTTFETEQFIEMENIIKAAASQGLLRMHDDSASEPEERASPAADCLLHRTDSTDLAAVVAEEYDQMLLADMQQQLNLYDAGDDTGDDADDFVANVMADVMAADAGAAAGAGAGADDVSEEAAATVMTTYMPDTFLGYRPHRSDPLALQSAVAAVLDGGLSLGQAARKYNVVKSTIWTRVAKDPKHRRRKANHQLNETIREQLLAGVSLSAIARTLNVAKSTVYQHKTRLLKRGVTSLRDTNCPEQRLVEAFRGYRVHGMSVRFASEFYSVPLTSLWRFIKRHTAARQKAIAANDCQPPSEEPGGDSGDSDGDDCDGNEENQGEAPLPLVATIQTEIDSEDHLLFERALLSELLE